MSVEQQEVPQEDPKKIVYDYALGEYISRKSFNDYNRAENSNPRVYVDEPQWAEAVERMQAGDYSDLELVQRDVELGVKKAEEELRKLEERKQKLTTEQKGRYAKLHEEWGVAQGLLQVPGLTDQQRAVIKTRLLPELYRVAEEDPVYQVLNGIPKEEGRVDRLKNVHGAIGKVSGKPTAS